MALKKRVAITSSVFSLITLGLIFSVFLISSKSGQIPFHSLPTQRLQNPVVVIVQEYNAHREEVEEGEAFESGHLRIPHSHHEPAEKTTFEDRPNEFIGPNSSETHRIGKITEPNPNPNPEWHGEVELMGHHHRNAPKNVWSPSESGDHRDTNSSEENVELGISVGEEVHEKSSEDGHGHNSQEEVCKDRYLYIYELPREFNEDLVDKCGRISNTWDSMCGNLENYGYGPMFNLSTSTTDISDTDILVPPHAWFSTEQFSGELLFHHRLAKSYPCLTRDPHVAHIFFIPFYAAMDSAFTLFSSRLQLRDRLTQRLIGWLTANPTWNRFKEERKHFMVLGRTTWDFSRSEDSDGGWGTSLSAQLELSHVTKLLIERNAWRQDEVGVPYPTSFHPSSDQDIEIWQKKVRSSKREFLCSFIGSKSRGNQWTKDLRVELSTQCERAGNGTCKQVTCGGNWLPNTIDCTKRPDQLTNLFLSSTFCFQPPGDTPTRKSIFDSLIAGCIPVLFSKSSAYDQYLWHLPQNGSLYSVLFDGDDVINHRVDVLDTLTHIANDAQRLRGLQEEVVRMLPHLVYALPHNNISHPDFRDAVDISIDNLLHESRGVISI